MSDGEGNPGGTSRPRRPKQAHIMELRGDDTLLDTDVYHEPTPFRYSTAAIERERPRFAPKFRLRARPRASLPARVTLARRTRGRLSRGA